MEYVKSEAKHSKTAYSALTLSGLSFVSAILGVFFMPFILSPIAMIISHLSKGRLKTRHFAAQAAIVVAILAFILNCCMIALGIYKIQNDPQVRGRYDAIMQEMYGMSLDEYTEMVTEEFKVMLPEMPGK
jgi:predicted PurR-regulated permease PerM